MEEMNRREFVKTLAVATSAPYVFPRTDLRTDTVRVGVVGLRGRGQDHLAGFQDLPGVEVTAICDVDDEVIAGTRHTFDERGWKRPKTFKDMRHLLEDDSLDAVSFATPNHWYALGTIWACQTGKHVYVEKPASHNVREGRKMVEAARRYRRVVQVGHQIRSSIGARAAVDFLASGQLGEVYMAKGLCYKWRDTISMTPDEPVPLGVDYDLWLGPAPRRPFSRNRFHYNWHWHWDYGNGDLGNQGVHQLDVARWGLGVSGHPDRVSGAGGHVMFDDDQETPNILHASYSYERDGQPPLILHFEVRHWISNKEAAISPDQINTVGVIFYGSEGYLVVDSYSSWRAYLGDQREPGPHARAGGDHYANFIQAVRSENPDLLNCDIEEGHRSASLTHLANVSYRLGRSLDFDPATEAFPNDAEADGMLTRDYRDPYTLAEKV